MQKRHDSWLRNMAVATLVLHGALAAAADFTWRVPTSVPEGSPFYVNFLERFAKHAADLTDGKVEIQPFGAGVIVPALQVYEAVQNGVVEAGHSTPSYLVNQDPINGIFAGFPGGMGPQAYLTWIYEGGGRQRLEALRAQSGLKTLIVGIGATEVLAHSNVPIRSTADFKGMKFRTSGPWAIVMRDWFEAVPTVVPPGETYTLLQRKGVDAVEWATPSSNQPEGFHQAAKYIVIPGVHQPTFLWEVVLKQDTWNKLPKALQKRLEIAAELTTRQSLTAFYEADLKAMEQYQKGKNEVISLDAKVIAELAAAGQEWARKTAVQQKADNKPEMDALLQNYTSYQQRWRAQSGYLIRD